MKTIWVVEQGEYSDYRVVGIFTTKCNAQKVMDALNNGTDEGDYGRATIDEWGLDPSVAELNQGMSIFVVRMRKDGFTEESYAQELSFFTLGRVGARIWRRSQIQLAGYAGMPDVLEAFVWATDEKHAVKIANEKRIEFIAMGKWDDATR